MQNKVTKREVINMMLADEVVSANAVYKAYLEHELELLDKKSENRKPTKAQQENEGVKERILAALSDEGQTVTDILAKMGDSTLSNQRVSALLRQMVADGKVVKGSDKRRSLFSLA
jgi:hypothetical protein